MERTDMAFAIGDKVTYPYHGATLVEQIETREVLGTSREYLVLRYNDPRLTLRVPCDQATDAGLRQVIAGLEVDDVLNVLRRQNVRLPSNWSRRFKNHTEMLRSGDIYQLAEVLRNLAQQQRAKNLSAAEKRMFETARRLLVSELCLALDEAPDQIDVRLDEALGTLPA
jgi:CarD family transcriptional regulator